MNIPSSVGNGWIMDSEYKILWMTLLAAPDSLPEIVKCTCKSGCKTQRCSCTKAQLKCSDLCFVKADISKQQMMAISWASDDELLVV